jgi:hypothetical protein
MSNNLPEKFIKTDFDNNVLPKIQNKQYKKLLQNIYVLSADKTEYTLPDDLSGDDVLVVEHILRLSGLIDFDALSDIAIAFRKELDKKKIILLFAYNGTGKTRLSMEFKDVGREGEDRDTLYFNAFTEDLFSWNNDLENDESRGLKLNTDSRFFDGIEALEMDTRIRGLLSRYADFDFRILTKTEDGRVITYVSFERDVLIGEIYEKVQDIKISRGEENIFVWCFFLAVTHLALDKDEASPYSWVKYIYIDDPISSLDDGNTVAVAHHLAQLLKKSNGDVKTVVSSHHTLFFNVMCNEWGKAAKYFLGKAEDGNSYNLKTMHGDTARFYHVAMLRELKIAADSGELYTYHFNILRNIMEKTATFHGYTDFSHFIKVQNDDEEKTLLTRLVQVLNHGGYSLMEPIAMLPENKGYFRKILADFLDTYSFNQEIFS